MMMSLNDTSQPKRAVKTSRAQGKKTVFSYQQMVRILARIFYGGEIPPRDFEEDETGPDANARKKMLKHSYEGLGVILLDFLTSNKVGNGFVDEAVIAQELRLSAKFIRKTLRYLESEHLLVSESVKFAFKRTNVDEPDDPDIEVKKRHETHVFWAVDYPRVMDVVRLKLSGIEELLKRNSGNSVSIMTYQCPSCGAQFSSLQAASLIDMDSGVFRCEECKSVLEERGGEEVAGISQKSSNKERQNFFKDLAARFDAQVKPLVQQVQELEGIEPPDPGSLKDWYTTQKNEATRRAQRLEEARQKFKSSGASGAMELTEEQLLEWAERAEIAIALPGQGPQEQAEEQAKELPEWFRMENPSDSVAQGAAGPSHQPETEHESEIPQEETAQQRQLQMEYLQQYLRQVEALQSSGVELKVEEKSEDVTLVKKDENAISIVEEVPMEPQAKKPRVDQHEDDDIDWEDA